MLVTLREGVGDATGRSAIGAAGHAVLRRLRHRGGPGSRRNRRYLVRIGSGRRLDEALEAIRRLPQVEEAQPNFLYHALQSPSDPYYYLQWGLQNTGDNAAYTDFGLHGPDPRVSGADIGWEAARAQYAGYTPQPVIVGVIDSGIDLAHPDLSAAIWQNAGEIPGNNIDDDGNGYIDDVHGWDFAYNDSDPADGDAHGTHVSGIIGAITDNGIGISGVASNVRLMPLKFLDDSGSGSTADAIEAIAYAIDNGAQVLNNSWGGGGFDPALLDAIAEAGAAGILFVAAGDNHPDDNDIDPFYPSSYDLDNIISVAAATPWRDLADFSSYGRVTIDLAAPGDEIISTTPVNGPAGVPETSYQIGFPSPYPGLAPWSGTSMATPAVSGGAALLYGLGDLLWPGVWPVLTPVERSTAVRDRILSRAARWASLSGTSATGGHLDLYNLVENDSTAPDPVGASLQLVSNGSQFVTLRWTATGDDGSTGRANYYDLRYQPGNVIDFDTATPAVGVWTPAAPGSMEHFTLTGLLPSTDYTLGLEVVDNAGNRSTRSDLTVTTLPAVVFFDDDMEMGANGWTSPDWALTTEAYSSPAHSWTDSPGGNYPKNANLILTSPEIPTDGSALTLTFMHRYDIESGYDFGYLEARAYAGGQWGAWSNVATYTGSLPVWTAVTVTLPVAGDSIQLRFRLVSDYAIQLDGWHIDDVKVMSSTATTTGTVLFADPFDGDDCSRWSLAGAWGCESNTLSDSPGADYQLNNRASARLLDPLDLTGTQAVTVSFDFIAFNYESGYDFLFFEYSLDGTSWRKLARYTGNLSGQRTLDLGDLAGQPTVYFRFRSLGDYGISEAGARIDNVHVVVVERGGCSTDAECDDGLFCTGVESCDAGTGDCLPGTPPVIDDGVVCTLDSCDESTDTIVHLPDDTACDDGHICTADSCDPVLDCSSAPIPGCFDSDNDGVEDAADNCPAVPNGPAAGTCVSGPVGAACLTSNDCVMPNGTGLCSLAQEDLDADGAGDACDPDQDGDGYDAALGDCDDRSATVHPGAAEVCDGLDDNCDGNTDNVPPPPVISAVTLSGDTLSWTPLAGAAVYDVVGGDLDGLATGGMTAVTSGCVAEDLPPASVILQTTPPLGGGFWFVVRGAHCGGVGSYGVGEPPLPQSRDEAIALSGNDCAP